MPDRRIFVALDADEVRALCELAVERYRTPQEQATKFVIEGLTASGVLPPMSTPHQTDCYGERLYA